MSHILVVEDDPDIANLVRHYLERAGHSVEAVTDGTAVLPRVAERRPDLVVLDLMLPGLHGLDVCRALRRRPDTADVAILVVTARAAEADRIAGLDLGADDYVTKPFSPKELVARVGALLRRARRSDAPAAEAGPLAYAAISLDREHHEVRDGGREVVLTAKEFLLLEHLMRNRGRVLSRDHLLTEVWGYQYTGGTRTVDVHVRRLREKLPALVKGLVTVKQFGYKLSDPPRHEETPPAGASRP
ncbi:MAG TPA: response regulator transcription factor [Vicinamibacterales bacterium]|nr:response regulator transcription factor [Vicinamibacterales bacterium]